MTKRSIPPGYYPKFENKLQTQLQKATLSMPLSSIVQNFNNKLLSPSDFILYNYLHVQKMSAQNFQLIDDTRTDEIHL